MHPPTIARLLAKGGAPGERYNGLLDPAGADELGEHLARLVRPYRPSVLLIGESAEDAVLAYVVARALGVPAIRSYVDEGVVVMQGDVPDGGSVVVLSVAFRDRRAIEALASRSRERHCRLVAAAALFETDPAVLAGLPFPGVVLYRADDAQYDAKRSRP
jgi:hypothetical protein